MKLLLDTHAFIWWTEGDDRFPRRVRSDVMDLDLPVFVSAATLWEMATLIRLRKLDGWDRLAGKSLADTVLRAGFALLPMAGHHAELAGGMKARHKDPFDRMLAAQALIEDLTLVSCDKAMDEFGVRRIW